MHLYLMIRDIEGFNKAITALQEDGLVLKVLEGLHDYLSCEVKISKDKKRAWLGQTHLIKNLVKKFRNGVKII